MTINHLVKRFTGFNCCHFLILILLLFSVFVQTEAKATDDIGNVYAIKAGNIITVTNGIIKDGTIIIRDGIIEAVGKNINIPVEAEVIEADTMTVFPGFIDAFSAVGIKQEKQKPTTPSSGRTSRSSSSTPSNPLTPEKLAADMLNPKDSKIKLLREIGVTTILSAPSRGIFIGQSALINLAGDKPEEMLLKSPVAMHIGYSRSRTYPSTLMGVIAFQRQTFFDAKHHQFLWQRYAKQKRGWRRPKPNKSLQALSPVLAGKMPVILSANRENEIKRALKLTDEFKLNYMICGVTEGWRVANLLKTQNKPVILSVNFPKPDKVTGYPFKLKIEGPKKEKKKEEVKEELKKKKKVDSKPEDKEKTKATDEQKKKEKSKSEEKKGETKKANEKKKKDDPEKIELYANAGKLHQAGVKFAFTSGGMKKLTDYIKNVAKTVKHGLPKEEALKALTINPAEIFGVADQVGSIEDGKIANLVVATGCIFDEKTSLRYIFVDGKKFEIKKKEKPKKNSDGGKATVNVTGTWDVTVDSPQGEVGVTLVLKQSGSDVSGEFKNEFGITDVYDASVSGNKIQFSVKLPIANPPVEIVFEGTVAGNSVDGSIDLGEMGTAEWSGTKPGFFNATIQK
jgi:imidazolonepropionase-like amidohydrolase